jgi:hypothetical protein
MALFHVFVEGATDGSPTGMSRLADAIAKRYGLQVADVVARLRKGRVRVKADVERHAADQQARELQRLGARVTVEEAKPQYQSGLAAAFSSETPAASLGALEQDGMLSLASVDGEEAPAEKKSAGSFAPPPVPTKPPPNKPKDVALDLFAPPEQGEELKVEIAADDRTRASTPPPIEEPAASVRFRPSAPKLDAKPSSGAIPRAASPPVHSTSIAAGRFGRLGEPRVRFAAGVLVAILIGFLPAHFVASMREDSAYTAIDTKVRVAQQLADTPETYAALDRVRADALARKHSERRTAAVIAFVIWALAGGGIAYAWFRKIPWDR